MISLRDYEGVQGFGVSSFDDVEQLNKALSAGNQRPPSSGGSALRVESLEATLRAVTFSLENIKLWKRIPKLPAFSTVEEYNLLSQYGEEAGEFTTEGALPEAQDSSYDRKVAYVKFMGVQGEVTHPMTLVRPAHGNVIALETQNKAKWLIERLERSLFNANSALVPQAFDGLKTQILAGAGITTPWSQDPVNSFNTVLDLRGAYPTEDDIETATNFVVQNYGTPNVLYSAPKALSQLAKSFYPRERVNLPAPTEGKVGLAVTSMVTQAGLVGFEQDIFLRSGGNNGRKVAPVAATSPKAPAAPASMTVANGGADVTSKFVAADAGVYYYRVTAINAFGESAPTSGSGPVTLAAGEKTNLTIVDGGGSFPATAFRIYRSLKNASGATLAQEMMTVPAATLTPSDLNFWIPGTSTMFLLQENLAALSFRQLAPMMKIPLATIAASIRWMQLLYGTPIVYAPKKHVLLINVGDA